MLVGVAGALRAAAVRDFYVTRMPQHVWWSRALEAIRWLRNRLHRVYAFVTCRQIHNKNHHRPFLTGWTTLHPKAMTSSCRCLWR